jgi:hypothetical protein
VTVETFEIKDVRQVMGKDAQSRASMYSSGWEQESPLTSLPSQSWQNSRQGMWSSLPLFQ